MAFAQHRRHLRFGFWQDHHHGLFAVGREAVTFIGRRVFAVPKQSVGGQHSAQRSHHLGLPLRSGVGSLGDGLR